MALRLPTSDAPRTRPTASPFATIVCGLYASFPHSYLFWGSRTLRRYRYESVILAVSFWISKGRARREQKNWAARTDRSPCTRDMKRAYKKAEQRGHTIDLFDLTEDCYSGKPQESFSLGP